MKQLLNTSGQIKRWPKKLVDKVMALEYLATKFEMDMIYAEKEVNVIINKYHIFNDTTLLRRELIGRKYLSRKNDGSKYWKV